MSAATPSNLDGLQMRAVLARLRGATSAGAADRSAAAVPISHVARFERYLTAAHDGDRRAFVDGIRNELPHETFLELAAWYHDLGRGDEARELLRLAPQTGEVLYWLAYLQQQANDPAAGTTLRQADAASARLVFPFRAESAPVFEWAVRQSSNWRPKYYLGLILWSRNETARARDLFGSCGSAPDWAPFYAARARLFETTARDASLADLRKAAELDPGEWRYGKALAERFVSDRAFPEALEIAGRYSRALPTNYILGMLHARTLLLNDRVADAAAILGTLAVLPFEGSTEGRTLYREAQLRLAAQVFQAGDAAGAARRVAAAREWPERLGAGKPYPDEVDERVEDWMAAQCLERTGRPPRRVPRSPDWQPRRSRPAAWVICSPRGRSSS